MKIYISHSLVIVAQKQMTCILHKQARITILHYYLTNADMAIG